MKKVFLTLALVALVVASCRKVDAPARLTTVNPTSIQVDSVEVDSTSVDTTTVK